MTDMKHNSVQQKKNANNNVGNEPCKIDNKNPISVVVFYTKVEYYYIYWLFTTTRNTKILSTKGKVTKNLSEYKTKQKKVTRQLPSMYLKD